MTFQIGDRCLVNTHKHGKVARIMAIAEDYAMLRYPRCAPFVTPLAELCPADNIITHKRGVDYGDYRVYSTIYGNFIVACKDKWLDGIYPSVCDALTAAKNANKESWGT